MPRVGPPAWRRDGRELHVLAADDRTVLTVELTPGEVLAIETPRPSIRLGTALVDMNPTRDLDRFLVTLVPEEKGRSSATALIDWRGLLERAE